MVKTHVVQGSTVTRARILALLILAGSQNTLGGLLGSRLESVSQPTGEDRLDNAMGPE